MCAEIHDRTSTERASEIDKRTTTRSSRKSRSTCLVLRDVSSMETDADEHQVQSLAGCADDVDVLDVIETCYGLRPILLSKRFIDRRSNASGKYWYDFLLVVCFYLVPVY